MEEQTKQLKSGIYQIVNKVNGKKYVGSSNDIMKRWSLHKSLLNRKKHHSTHLQSAWDKHGKDKFIFEIIENVEDNSLLYEREQYWLDLYKTYNGENGYNISKDSKAATRGRTHSEETKQKISKAHKGKLRSDMTGPNNIWFGKHLPEEIKRKIKENHADCRKEKNAFYGKKHTVETKEKISKANKGKYIGKIFSEETKQKMREKRALQIFSDETKEKLRKRFQGEGSFFAKLTKEIVLEIRDKFDTNNYTKAELAREYNVNWVTISNIVRRQTWRNI